MLNLLLNDADDTMELGRMLGLALAAERPAGERVRALYLFGDLGGGKTTLTRGLVAALPGGGDAEVASPSFTLCNEYPTRPPVLHADLYRLGRGASLPEELEACAEEEAAALLVLEWPEHLNPVDYAPDRLDVALAPYGAEPPENLDIPGQPCERKRLAGITAHGDAARRLLAELEPRLAARFPAAPPADGRAVQAERRPAARGRGD